jgi:arsenite-transporting ATPase
VAELCGLLPVPTPRHLFFTGKGGVGKTSTACAVAVALASVGKRVLLVSTDPASNVDEVFGLAIGTDPTHIVGVDGLDALNIDPEAAAVAYRERVVGPYRDLLPPEALASIEEQFAGACTVEIAAFDEFSKLLADADRTEGYDHVVFDTAPTGHTLRLLSLPKAWTGFLSANIAGGSCVGPLQGLAAQRALYDSAMQSLADSSSTLTVLVARPDRSALDEAARTSRELETVGMVHQRLVVNGVLRQGCIGDPVADAMAAASSAALQQMPRALAQLRCVEVALKPAEILGIEALRRFFAPAAAGAAGAAGAKERIDLPDLSTLIDDLQRTGPGVILTMGKGGVGKTTVAAELALGLADRGADVLLTTTDPAAHVRAAVGQNMPRSLTIAEIDPKAEVARYRAEVLATTGPKLDAAGLALLEEDLNSPCTEEIAVFRAFARSIAGGKHRVVIVDTAPTGHTILLLDAAQAYHREVMRQASGVTEAIRELLPRLRDPSFTRVLLCAVAEATPVHEAAALQSDLRRAGVEPFAWVLTHCLSVVETSDPVLMARQAQERRYISEVVAEHARSTYLLPWDAKHLERTPRQRMEAVQA